MQKLRELPRKYLCAAAGAAALALLCPGGVLLLSTGTVLGYCGGKYLQQAMGEGGEK